MANPVLRAITSTGAVLKKFGMTFGYAWGSMWADDGTGRGWNWARSLGRTRYDYANQTDPAGNSIVVATVLWVCRTFPEAPIQVLQDQSDDTQEPIRRHPFTQILKRPNPYYSGILLWQSSLADLLTAGNAYWVKVRSGAGRVVELWWVPQRMMQPRWPQDGSAYLSHYEYRPDGINPVRVEVEDVVHFRYGLDPENVRKGLSPLASLMREIFTDDEAANFTGSILKNLGVPGVVISPDDDVSVGVDDLEHVKAEFMARFGGDRRGEPLVMSGKTKVTVLSFTPEQMDLRALRMIPEERISAVLGVPAAVVGLGTGLANTKVGATMSEMREQAFENCIIPMQRLLAEELNVQLLGDFGDPATLEVGFDLTKVRVLQDDQDKLHERAREDLKAGGITLDEFRSMIGLDGLDGDDGNVLYVPNTLTVKDPTTLLDVPEPPVPVLAPSPGQPGLPSPQPADALPVGKVPAALAAPPRKSLLEATRRYADADLVAALQEHALVLAEAKGPDADDVVNALVRKGQRNGHAAGLS